MLCRMDVALELYCVCVLMSVVEVEVGEIRRANGHEGVAVEQPTEVIDGDCGLVCGLGKIRDFSRGRWNNVLNVDDGGELEFESSNFLGHSCRHFLSNFDDPGISEHFYE